jgi:hypothetical protein
VESCPQKEAIFNVISTWEKARAANAFPRWVKAALTDPANSFHLETVGTDEWNLYKINKDGSQKQLVTRLIRRK